MKKSAFSFWKFKKKTKSWRYFKEFSFRKILEEYLHNIMIAALPENKCALKLKLYWCDKLVQKHKLQHFYLKNGKLSQKI